MSRAVKAYVERSEARRRGEQGGGVSLEVLVKRKKVRRRLQLEL